LTRVRYQTGNATADQNILAVDEGVQKDSLCESIRSFSVKMECRSAAARSTTAFVPAAMVAQTEAFQSEIQIESSSGPHRWYW
jgi:hypothetical protein